MTKKQIKFYQDEVVRYMELFGLGRWTIKFVPWDSIDFPTETAADSDAVTLTYQGSRFVKFSINPAKEVSDINLSRAAVHEVTHVLTARLEDFAYNKGALDEDAIREEMEAVAKSMERAFYGMVEA